MNKKQLTKIYKSLSLLLKNNNLINDKLLDFLNTIAPETNNYTLIERNSFFGAMTMLNLIYGKDFNEDVNYWFFECKEGKGTNLYGTDKNGKKYTFNKLSNYLDFVCYVKDY